MSQAQDDPEPVGAGPTTIEDLARVQHAEPVADPGELAAQIWGSDAELEAFLADLRASRSASLARPGVRDIVIDTDVASLLQKREAPQRVLRHLAGARIWPTGVTVGELAKWTVGPMVACSKGPGRRSSAPGLTPPGSLGHRGHRRVGTVQQFC